MAKISNTTGIEGLLMGPYRWNAVTYSGFLHDAYDKVIKEEVERLQMIEVEERKQQERVKSCKSQNKKCSNYQTSANNAKNHSQANFNQSYDVKIAKLVQKINNESDQVLGNENWTDIIGSDLWDILKLDEYGKDRYKLDNDQDVSVALRKKSAVQLLKFIRNKISHIRTCKNDLREKLTQFFEKDDDEKYQLQENKFVEFWISKFPKLVPYLWLKLYKFRNKLAIYYPDYGIEIGKLQNFLLDTKKLEMAIQIALYDGIEKGNLWRRFKGPSCSLEFRGFQNLVKFLDNNIFISVMVTPKRNVVFSVSHSSTNQNKLNYEGSALTNEKIILFFTDNITDKNIWKYCSNCDCRVIVFCDPDKLTNENIEQAVGKFKYENDLTVELSEFPLSGSELSTEKQDWLFENGQVSIQDRDIKIKDITSDRIEMLQMFSSNLLNILLKEKKVCICGRYKYPDHKSSIYINRRLYSTDKNGKEGKNLKEELAKEKLDHENEIRKKFQKKTEWPIHDFRKRQPKSTGIIGVLEENKFLRGLHRNKIKSIYFLAKTGMGKSELLLSLGENMKNSLVIYCSFRHFVDVLKKRVETEIISKSDIKFVILEILKCRDKCERKLIGKWLEIKGNTGVTIDLQLDGLDDIPSVNLQIALRALEIIEKDLHAIRLWITSSKPFPKTQREFGFKYYGILPLSIKDKLNFFKMACMANNLSEDEMEDYSSGFSKRLFLEKEFVAFLDYPLNFSMILELYEDNLKELTIVNGEGLGWEVFNSHFDKRFAIMYREKKGIKLDSDDDDFKMQRENYLQLYTYLALVRLFPRVSSRFVQPSSMQYFTKENYHKMGIITNNEPITFIHIKYAHYFVARYVVKVLETGKLYVLCPEDLFFDMLVSGSPARNNLYPLYMWEFVDEYLQKVSNFNSIKWLETYKFCWCTEKNIIGFIATAFTTSHWNLSKLLINLCSHKTDTSFRNPILFIALLSQPSSEWFISMCRQSSYNNEVNLLMYSVKRGHYDIAKYLIEEKCDYDVFDKIAEKRHDGGGILHCLVDLIKHEDSENTSVFKLFTDSGAGIFVKNTIDFIKYLLIKSPNEIERKDNRGCKFLQALPVLQISIEFGVSSNTIFPIKEFLINELNADINDTSTDGDSVLSMELDMNYKHPIYYPRDHIFMNCKQKFDSENMKVYHKTLALVTSKNFIHINLKHKVFGLTPLQEAVLFFGSKLRPNSLEMFRACGADFNVLDGEGDTILHYCVKNCDDIEFIKQLVKYGCKMTVQNGKLLCALCLAERERKVDSVIFFRKMLKLKGKQKCPLNCATI